MKHVLILDDDQWTVRLLSHFLKDSGFEITGTTSAHEALDIIRQGVPDLIISDVLMPQMDGFSVVETVRADNTTSHIPLLFISSLADEANIRKAMNMGVDDYLVKPIERELLLETIEARITRKMQYQYQYEIALQRLRYNLTHVLPHELRTPLSGIIGVTSLLSSSLEKLDNSTIEELIRSLNQSTIRLSKAVEETLMYSKLELILHDTEKITQERKRRYDNPLGIIQDTVYTTAEYRNRASDVVFINRLDASEKQPTVAISGGYLQVLVEQICDNACKYSPHNTALVCEIQRTDTELILTVSDEGRGISREQIKEVDAFVQFEREYYEQQGIGIGLALVKKIIQLVGGSFAIDSTIGVGTRVIVSLPISESKSFSISSATNQETIL